MFKKIWLVFVIIVLISSLTLVLAENGAVLNATNNTFAENATTDLINTATESTTSEIATESSINNTADTKDAVATAENITGAETGIIAAEEKIKINLMDKRASELILPDESVISCLYYFYAEECTSCKSLDLMFSNLIKNYPNLKIEKFEIYHNLKNYELLQQYFNAYKITNSAFIPVVFTSSSYYVGAKPISSFLEKGVRTTKNSVCPSLEDKPIGILGKGETKNVLETLGFGLISGRALQNMFFPGMTALFLILLAILSLQREQKKIVKNGLLFIIGVYFSYVLFGLGLFQFLYNQSLNTFFYKLVGLGAIIYGLIGIKSVYTSWTWALKNLPGDLHHYLKRMVDFSLSQMGIFLIGFVVALFTFAGVTDTFYLLRDLFIEGFMRSAVLPLILYYNLVLLLLLVGVVFGFDFAVNKISNRALGIKDVEKNKEERKEIMKYVNKDIKRELKKEKFWKKHDLKILRFLSRIIVLSIGLVLLFL